MSVGCLVATAILAADAVTQEKAIAIASEFLRSPKLDITSYEISAERCTTPPCDANHIPAERFGSHAFWLVSFTPRDGPGGAYDVYVATDTGEILGSRMYR
jgi:hypothetical protein